MPQYELDGLECIQNIQLCLRSLQVGFLIGKFASIAYAGLHRISTIEVLLMTGTAREKNRCMRARRMRIPRENLVIGSRVSICQQRVSWYKHWGHGQCQPGHSMYGDAFMLTNNRKGENTHF